MEGIAKWLSDISWPIVSRLLASMGLGTVTYGGLSEAFDGAVQSASESLSALGPIVLGLVARAGLFDFFSITSGGIVAGLSWMVLKHFALQSGTASP